MSHAHSLPLMIKGSLIDPACRHELGFFMARWQWQHVRATRTCSSKQNTRAYISALCLHMAIQRKCALNGSKTVCLACVHFGRHDIKARRHLTCTPAFGLYVCNESIEFVFSESIPAVPKWFIIKFGANLNLWEVLGRVLPPVHILVFLWLSNWNPLFRVPWRACISTSRDFTIESTLFMFFKTPSLTRPIIL